MKYRVTRQKNLKSGSVAPREYKYGSRGYGWEIDTNWYDNDPGYRGALDEMMGLGMFEGTAHSPTSNPTNISSYGSGHNLMNRLNAAHNWLQGGRAAYYAAQAPKPAPAPVAAPTPVPAAPSLAPTPLQMSGAEAPVQGAPAGGSASPTPQWSFGDRRSTQGVASGKTFDPLSKRQSIMGSRGAFNRGGLRISSLNI